MRDGTRVAQFEHGVRRSSRAIDPLHVERLCLDGPNGRLTVRRPDGPVRVVLEARVTVALGRGLAQVIRRVGFEHSSGRRVGYEIDDRGMVRPMA